MEQPCTHVRVTKTQFLFLNISHSARFKSTFCALRLQTHQRCCKSELIPNIFFFFFWSNNQVVRRIYEKGTKVYIKEVGSLKYAQFSSWVSAESHRGAPVKTPAAPTRRDPLAASPELGARGGKQGKLGTRSNEGNGDRA